MRSFKIGIVGLLIVFGFGCKSTQVYYKKKGDLKNIPDYKLVNSIQENYLDYNSLFFKKFKAEVSFNGDSKSFKGNLYVLKDSSIIVSILPLMGIELYRVKLSPGKVEIIDRPKKKYSQGDYKILWDKFLVELDYQTLQGILTNELFIYPIGDDKKAIKRYKHELGDSLYQLQSVKEGKFERKYKKEKVSSLIYHQFSILPDVFKISKVYINDFGVNSKLSVSYKNLIKKENTFFPSELEVSGSRGNDDFAINIQFAHIDVNSESSLGFKVSDKFEKINLNNER